MSYDDQLNPQAPPCSDTQNANMSLVQLTRPFSHFPILHLARHPINCAKLPLRASRALPRDINPNNKTNMSFFRITLHRSAIGLPERTRGVLASLGLRKRTQTVFHPVSPQFAGMVMKVKELVKVEEVDKALTPKEMREERRPERGFWLERPAPRV